MNERKIRLETVIADKRVNISVREWRVTKPIGQVICLHGFGVNGAEYAPMAERLNQLRYDVLMPDWIGHGDSDFLGDPAAYTWDCYLKGLGTVLRHYDAPNTHYVGTSFGGALLLMFLLARPVLPQSAIIVDVPLKGAPTLSSHYAVFDEQRSVSFGTIDEANAFLQKQRPEFARVPERFQKYFDAERFVTKDGRIVFKFDPAIIKAAARKLPSHDWTPALMRLRFKILFLYGKTSPYRVMADFMTICARMPNIRYRDDLRGGHPPMLLHEEQYEPIIEFIRQTNR